MRLIAPDRPGFGESSFKPGRTIGAWADDVVQLADRLGLDRFALLGVSGGGPYALACAARMPDRVSRVALVGGLGPLSREELTKDMRPFNRSALRLAARSPALARLGVRVAACRHQAVSTSLRLSDVDRRAGGGPSHSRRQGLPHPRRRQHS